MTVGDVVYVVLGESFTSAFILGCWVNEQDALDAIAETGIKGYDFEIHRVVVS